MINAVAFGLPIRFCICVLCMLCVRWIHSSWQPGLELISKLRFTYSNVYTLHGCHGVRVSELQLPGQVRKHGIIAFCFRRWRNFDMLPVGMIRFASFCISPSFCINSLSVRKLTVCFTRLPFGSAQQVIRSSRCGNEWRWRHRRKRSIGRPRPISYLTQLLLCDEISNTTTEGGGSVQFGGWLRGRPGSIPGRKFSCLRFGRVDLRLLMGMGNLASVVYPACCEADHSQPALVLGLVISGAVSSPFRKPSWRVACLKRTGTASLL
jgi:hypothetical protein